MKQASAAGKINLEKQKHQTTITVQSRSLWSVAAVLMNVILKLHGITGPHAATFPAFVLKVPPSWQGVHSLECVQVRMQGKVQRGDTAVAKSKNMVMLACASEKMKIALQSCT